jgi:glutathione S-transferase
MTAQADVTLFGHWICPYAVRVRFALAQRGIDHTLIEVPPTAARPKGFVVPEEFLEHSPKREIPLLRIGDRYLADSIPILEWMETEVAERPLLPADASDRALVRQRVVWLDERVFRPMIGVYYGTDPARISAAGDLLGQALAEMADWLDHSPWLAGDAPTLAEAIAVAFYTRLDGLRRLGFVTPLPEAIAAHLQQCTTLPGWAAVAWSAEQTDEFVGRFEKFREIAQRNVATD